MVKLGDAWGFQQRKLAALKKQSFAKLSALSESTALKVPARLKGLDIFVRRKPAAGGGLKITVSVEAGGMASTDGFEMLPSGKIIRLHDDVPEPRRRAKARQTGRGRGRRGLPPRIKSEVLRYLHLEYGESPRSQNALTLSELSYEGERLHEGMPTHFWSYPTSSGKAYATVVLSTKGYAIGMTDQRPSGQPSRRSKK